MLIFIPTRSLFTVFEARMGTADWALALSELPAQDVLRVGEAHLELSVMPIRTQHNNPSQGLNPDRSIRGPAHGMRLPQK